MKTQSKITNKERVKSQINSLAKFKGMRVLEEPNVNVWKLFERDQLIANIELEIFESFNSGKIKVPIFSDVSISLEIFIKSVLIDPDIREIINQDKLYKIGDTIFISRPIKYKIGSHNSRNILSYTIQDLIEKADKLGSYMDCRLATVQQFKLN